MNPGENEVKIDDGEKSVRSSESVAFDSLLSTLISVSANDIRAKLEDARKPEPDITSGIEAANHKASD